MKKFELCSLHGCTGSYTAVLLNRPAGCYVTRHFLCYTKKEIFHTLRHDYGCTVGRRFYS